MKSDQDRHLERDMRRRLDLLREVPERSTQAASHGRAQYLAQARELASSSALTDRATWAGGTPLASRSLFARLARPVLSPGLAVVLVILILALGAAPLTVYAAQGSLPHELLYPLKVWSEDLRLSTAPAETQLALALEFAGRRVDEMAAMNEQASPIPGKVLARFEAHEALAMQAVAGMENGEMRRALQQVQLHLEQQEQSLFRLQIAGSAGDPAITQAQVIVQRQARLVEAGLLDPSQFRRQIQHKQAEPQPTSTAEPATDEVPLDGGGTVPQDNPGSGPGEATRSPGDPSREGPESGGEGLGDPAPTKSPPATQHNPGHGSGQGTSSPASTPAPACSGSSQPAYQDTEPLGTPKSGSAP